MLTLKSVGASVVVGSMALTPETASATAANALDSFIVDFFFRFDIDFLLSSQ